MKEEQQLLGMRKYLEKGIFPGAAGSWDSGAADGQSGIDAHVTGDGN